MIAGINPVLRGWAGYFGFSEGYELADLDGWIRRRLRCMLWVQWKTRRRRFQELRQAGVGEKAVYAAIMSPKGPWRMCASEALHRALRNKTFAKQGLVTMTKPTPPPKPPNRRVRTRTHGGVGGAEPQRPPYPD